MDKESKYELQKIDCNCNDCYFLERDFEKTNKHKDSYKGTGLSDHFQYGKCKKDGRELFFSPNTCQVETQDCFEHRIDHWDDEKKKNWFQA